MRTCKMHTSLSGPRLGGAQPTTRLNGPRECTPIGTPKHQEGNRTILLYERPASNYHCYTMQPHIVYIPK
jgi:hypothetical protein